MKRLGIEGIIMLFIIFINFLLYLYGVSVSGTLYIPDWDYKVKDNIVGAIIFLFILGLMLMLLKTLYNIEVDKQQDERDKE